MEYLKSLFFIALLPIFVIGYFIYKADKIEKESKSILIRVFLGGVLATFITLILSGFLEMFIPFFSTENEANLNLITLIPYYFIGVALIEEFSKWIFVYLFCWKSKEFNYMYDAIVYCVFASLGFAALENILYVVLNGGIGVGIMRSILAVPGHAFFAVYMGYYLGLSKLTKLKDDEKKSNKYFIYSIIVPVLLHGIYDYLLSASSISSPLLFFLIFLIFVVLLYVFAIKMVRRISKIKISMYNNSEKKYCSNCGTLVENEFCSNCGKKV